MADKLKMIGQRKQVTPFFSDQCRGGTLLTNCVCREKPKNSIFENEQFNGYFVFDKNILFGEKKNFFTPISNFIFLRKNISLFFEKQLFFLEIF